MLTRLTEQALAVVAAAQDEAFRSDTATSEPSICSSRPPATRGRPVSSCAGSA